MMIFDPESGENLTRDESEADRIDAENEEDRKASLARSKEREERELRTAG
jgi:multiple sugar transport system ATP-binding protein